MQINKNYSLIFSSISIIIILYYLSNILGIISFLVLVASGGAAIAIPEIQFFGPTINHGSRQKKLVALTFDDGPYGLATDVVIKVLKEKNIKAAFFVLGRNVKKYPKQLEKITNEGHIVGNHSMDHSKLLFLRSRNNYLSNIQEAENNIYSVIARRPRFYRPPWGLRLPDAIAALKLKRYRIILWDVIAHDPFAWASPSLITKEVLKKIRPGSIITLHDGRDTKINYPRENVIEALPAIIDGIRAKGYKIVPLDQLIGEPAYF